MFAVLIAIVLLEQQRQFNTFVRDSINQLLGSDFMRTHDVQDIDSQVMEMIRSKLTDSRFRFTCVTTKDLKECNLILL